MTNGSKIISAPDSETIIAEAASWVAQIDSDRMTNADRLALREWAARSPRHLAELKRLGGMWCDLDSVLEVNLPKNEDESVLRVLSAGARVRPQPVFGAVAGCIALLIAAFTITPLLLAPNASYQVAYQVDEGANELFSLPDGSKVHLNTNSLVEIEFDEHQRQIRLIRGEAHFTVAKDANRPFVVFAGTSVVRAVGTAFSVRLDATDTSIIVTEGVVELGNVSGLHTMTNSQNSPQIDANNTVLAAGQVAHFRQHSEQPELIVRQISEQKIDTKLAWRKGLLIFDGEPLTYVVDEISRYTASNVIISDPDIRNIPIGGVFPAGEVNSLLGALESSFGIEINRIDENTIYLSKRQSG